MGGGRHDNQYNSIARAQMLASVPAVTTHKLISALRRSRRQAPVFIAGFPAALMEGIMKATIAATLMALSVTTAGAAQTDHSASYWLRFCKDYAPA
jgi:hypothetical protein